MKALVLTAPNDLRIQEVPLPTLRDDDVMVRVMACGICGSDVHGMGGSTGRRIPPIVMGHEAAGTVTDIGSRVRGWAVGDRVTFDSTIFCGECWYCRRGLINLCDHRRVLGVSCAEYHQDGAFAEYVAVPSRILYKLPESVTFEQAAMVEALSIAMHAVRRSPPGLDDKCVVVGAGIIGLLTIQALKRAGCGTIIAIDVDQNRLILARQTGAIEALEPGATATQRIQELTGGRGADSAFEAVGNSSALATAIDSVRKGGALTLIGNVCPVVEFGLQSVVTREITVRGSCASCWEYPACLDLIERNEVNLDPLISSVAPMEDGAKWFRRLQAREKGLMKVILKPGKAAEERSP